MNEERFSLPSDRPSVARYSVLFRRHWRLLALICLPPATGAIWRGTTFGQWDVLGPCIFSMAAGYLFWDAIVTRTTKTNTGTYPRWNRPVGYWINTGIPLVTYLAITAGIFFWFER